MRSAPPWRMILAGPATLVGVGFLLGFRHAFEPDHLAAVSTLATRQGTVRDAMRLGAAWGVGHTATVGVVALILIAADLRLPSAFQPAAELVVAALLVGLGVTVLARHAARHRHAFGPAHEDAHRHHAAHAHVPPIRDARRSLAFGIAHFLEHIFFKGAERFKNAEEVASAIDSVGGDFNAFTGKEFTAYYAKSSSDKLNVIMDVIFDIYLNSKISK